MASRFLGPPFFGDPPQTAEMLVTDVPSGPETPIFCIFALTETTPSLLGSRQQGMERVGLGGAGPGRAGPGRAGARLGSPGGRAVGFDNPRRLNSSVTARARFLCK